MNVIWAPSNFYALTALPVCRDDRKRRWLAVTVLMIGLKRKLTGENTQHYDAGDLPKISGEIGPPMVPIIPQLGPGIPTN